MQLRDEGKLFQRNHYAHRLGANNTHLVVIAFVSVYHLEINGRTHCQDIPSNVPVC